MLAPDCSARPVRRQFVLGVVLLVAVSVIGCSSPLMSPSSTPPPHASKPAGPPKVVAVYLEPGSGGQLSQDDLSAHPEVAEVHDQAHLESLTTTRVAIWIDKGAVVLVDLKWLRAKADQKYPVALIGYNSALFSFRETLPIVGIHGPAVTWSQIRLTPGFSVWTLRGGGAGHRSGYLAGFDETPTVSGVLTVTSPAVRGVFPGTPPGTPAP